MKLHGHRPGLPGHVVASGKRAKEISFQLCPFLPAGRQEPRLSRFGGKGHLPVNIQKYRQSERVRDKPNENAERLPAVDRHRAQFRA